MLLEGIFRGAGTQEEVRNMTRTVLQTAVSAAAALALVTCFSSPSFAADGDNQNSTKQIKTLKFVAPKAPVAQFVAPKSGRTGSGLGSNGGSPTTVFRLTPKAPVAGSSSGSGTTTAQFVAPKAKKTGSGGSITAKFVAPKAKKVEPEVIAKLDTPSKPLLLAPATTSTAIAVDQGAPAPEPVAKAIPVETPDAGQIESSPREVALAYLRAAQRYGYGAYTASYSESQDEGSYEERAYDEDYSGANDGDENCW
jgi:hypothetical protein